ncbi:MAG: helix-turn-helix domain-containing protein [Bacteroidota bacterium]
MGVKQFQQFQMQGMRYILHKPRSPLSHVVDCMFEITGRPSSRLLRNYPIAKFELVFNLSGKAVKGRNHTTDKVDTCTDIVVRGSHTKLFELMLDHPLHLFIINFKPFVFPKLFDLSTQELTNTVLPMKDHLPQLRNVREQLQLADSPYTRMAMITQWLNDLASHLDEKQNQLVSWMRKKIEVTPTLRIKRLQQETGYSRQYLHRLFKQEIGFGLKTYQKIVRTNRILDELNSGSIDSLTALAHRYHFYDQSHFIKEFKQMTGTAPSAFLHNRLDKMPVQQTYFNS